MKTDSLRNSFDDFHANTKQTIVVFASFSANPPPPSTMNCHVLLLFPSKRWPRSELRDSTFVEATYRINPSIWITAIAWMEIFAEKDATRISCSLKNLQMNFSANPSSFDRLLQLLFLSNCVLKQ